MLERRYGQAQSTLADGRVLVSGGCAAVHPSIFNLRSSTAQIYDPRTNQWTWVASMITGRMEHSQSTLADGRVLVCGGAGPIALGAEIYDPEADEWTEVATLPPNMAVFGNFTQSTLVDGRVLVCDGGEAVANIYDPVSDTWSAAPPPRLHSTRRCRQSILADGRVFLYGGDGDDASSEIYDPALNQWLPIPPLRIERSWHAQSVLPSGSVLVSGGVNTKELDDQPEYMRFMPRDIERTVAVYHPTTHQVVSVPGMGIPRYNPSQSTLQDGRVLVCGGGVNFARCLADLEMEATETTEIYDDRLWSLRLHREFIPAARAWVSAVLLSAHRAGSVMEGVPRLPQELWFVVLGYLRHSAMLA